MENIRVSMRYAKAIYPVAKQNGFADTMIEDLAKVISLINTHKEFRLFINSPVIPHHKKLRIFEEIFKEHITEITYNFLILLIAKGRERIITGIHKCFVSIYNAENGILACTITTAIELDSQSKAKLEKKIADATNMKVLPEYCLNSKLIGGLQIRIEDWVYDASIRNKLKELHKSLIEE